MVSVIFGDNEDAKTVMDYQPKKLSLNISTQAKNFIVSQPQQSEAPSFRISELVAQQTGIQELEKASIEKRVEQIALERLKEIQESAYREAHSIGLEEGRVQGYDEAKDSITERLQCVNDLIEKLTRIKVDILQRNEIQIIDMIFYLTSKVAHFEIEKNNERIIPVLKGAIESLQKDEKMLIKISARDLAVIEELKSKSTKEFDFLSSAKLEPTEGLTPGGCIIETNYGLIDATLEERLSKLWQSLETAKPVAKKDEFE